MGAPDMHPGGRPPIFASVEEMEEAIQEYFAECNDPETPMPLTVSGLAYALGMSTETLRKYGDKDQFSATVKRAKQRVEMYLECRLDAAAPTGAIFNLKNNFGWKDQQDHTVSGGEKPLEVIERRIVRSQD
jgi:hypothetical protein